jgi:hypothetical protein
MKEGIEAALCTSHIVYGHQASGNRVLYLVDLKGKGDERFVADLQSQTERRLVKTKAGRPFSKGNKPVPN